MKSFLYSFFSTLLLFPIYSYANDSFSVEIEALTLVMEKYSNTLLEDNETDKNKPSYMAYKQDECNAKVEITEKTGLQIKTMESFEVNVCKKEIYRTTN